MCRTTPRCELRCSRRSNEEWTRFRAFTGGVALAESAGEAHVVIPKHLRSDREHFADVANKFFEYLNSPQTVPEWEKTNMLVKYYVTTKGVAAAQ